MIKKVVFFNFYHNGDLHVSRGLVKAVAERCAERKIPCEYYHDCSPSVLSDIPNVEHTTNAQGMYKTSASHVKNNVLFINTWYGADQDIFNGSGVSFDTLYRSFKKAVKPLEIDFDNIRPITMFPSIDYSKFKIGHAREWVAERDGRKKVFISNGDVLSGQFPNFKFRGIITKLAKHRQDLDILVSNHEPGLGKLPNVFITSDIIQKNGVDLNENSYLAAHCDVIVGRFSGTYTFAMTRETYWEKPKTFVVFTVPTVNTHVWTYQFTRPPEAKIVRYGCQKDREILSAIKENLPKLPK